MEATEQTQATQPQPKKGKAKMIMMMLILIITVAVIAVVGAVVYKHLIEDESSDSNEEIVEDQNSDATNEIVETNQPCSFAGQEYEDGESYDAADGCNTCTCSDGSVSCTEMACKQESDNPLEGFEHYEENDYGLSLIKIAH